MLPFSACRARSGHRVTSSPTNTLHCTSKLLCISESTIPPCTRNLGLCNIEEFVQSLRGRLLHQFLKLARFGEAFRNPLNNALAGLPLRK
jgi:hypothetical protein